jgi:hypothetical protein
LGVAVRDFISPHHRRASFEASRAFALQLVEACAQGDRSTMTVRFAVRRQLRPRCSIERAGDILRRSIS